jgi:hypothetical protein
LRVSFAPQSGDVKNFDYFLSFDQDKFIGLESKELKFTGAGQIVHTEGEQETKEAFTIEGPISDFRFSFEVGDNVTSGSKQLDYKGVQFKIDAEQTKI